MSEKKLRLGMLGLSPGNGHPYSWAAIFNGYDRAEMAKCPFSVIPEYLDRQDPATMRLGEGLVTHIWTQDPAVSRDVAAASRIENIVAEPAAMIGEVDAVLLARDDGENHLPMARPFIEAGIPILIDKPLTTRADHLAEFIGYYRAGRPIMSCSSARFAPSIESIRGDRSLGRILSAVGVTPKYWRTYAIHQIEAIYAVMGGGIESVRNLGRPGEEIAYLRYADGRHAIVESFAAIKAGSLHFYGDGGTTGKNEPDAFRQFRNMLQAFARMVITGQAPFDWRETVEMSRVVIAGQVSLDENGREVKLKELET